MKTTKLLLTMAVAAVAAAFTTQLQAGEPLLSPRAQANQTRTLSGVTEDKIDRANPFQHKGDLVLHPRGAGIGNDRDLVRENRNLAVSPRALATFPQLGASAADSGDMAACKTMKKGECSLPCCKTKTTCAMPCCKS